MSGKVFIITSIVILVVSGIFFYLAAPKNRPVNISDNNLSTSGIIGQSLNNGCNINKYTNPYFPDFYFEYNDCSWKVSEIYKQSEMRSYDKWNVLVDNISKNYEFTILLSYKNESDNESAIGCSRNEVTSITSNIYRYKDSSDPSNIKYIYSAGIHPQDSAKFSDLLKMYTSTFQDTKINEGDYTFCRDNEKLLTKAINIEGSEMTGKLMLSFDSKYESNVEEIDNFVKSIKY
jgi:hypothetical protein